MTQTAPADAEAVCVFSVRVGELVVDIVQRDGKIGEERIDPVDRRAALFYDGA